jgi:hypothetical protein
MLRDASLVCDRVTTSKLLLNQAWLSLPRIIHLIALWPSVAGP